MREGEGDKAGGTGSDREGDEAQGQGCASIIVVVGRTRGGRHDAWKGMRKKT